MMPTLVRLAFAGIRSRLLAAALTTVITAAAAATLIIALEVRASGVDPWQRTFDAANGAHVLAMVPTADAADALAALQGVADRDDPVPQALGAVAISGRSEPAVFAGLGGRPRIHAPVPIAGDVLPGLGILLERSFAEALGIPVGSVVGVPTPTGTVSLRVVGTAISPSQSRFPRQTPGLGWVSRDTLERIQPDQSNWTWAQPVRLADPAAAPAFVEAAFATLPMAEPGRVAIISWQEQRDLALLESQPVTVVVGMFTILLLTVAFAVIGILTNARISAQYRDIGLLKAVGLTPRQVTAVFLIEASALGLLAVVVGFLVGAGLAPRLATAGAQTLIGAPTIVMQPWHALLAGGVVLPVLLLSTALAARRGTRFTTLNAIRAGSPDPSRLVRVTGAGLPLAPTLGLKDLAARRRRAFWTGTAVAVTGAVIVATLQMRAALDASTDGRSDVPAGLSTLVYSLDVVLIIIGVTTLLAVTLLSVRERTRDLGVLKAVGLTPAQITSSLVSAHALLATVAAVLSVPAGVGLYLAVLELSSGTVQGAVFAPWWSDALVPVAVALVAAVATSAPARLAAQVPVAKALRYD
jgi:putative ABC transport system permease protein